MTLPTLAPVTISNDDFQTMLRFARLTYQLKHKPSYAQKISAKMPETAHFEATYPSVLMGFDFHLTDHGPKLIEINNNAAGLLSWKTHAWLEQPQLNDFIHDFNTRINTMFPASWKNIAILDSDVEAQFFYPEMQAYAELLSHHQRTVFLLSPEDLTLKEDGYLYAKDQKIDGIYNRHTDFYLDSSEMQHIRQAYLSEHVGLTPHPRSYALIGDKGRMVDWWQDDFFDDILSTEEQDLMLNVVPEIKSLASSDREQVWLNRKKYVFKPVASHGGKGVLIGKSVRQKRFQEMMENPENIVVQAFVPAPTLQRDDETFKYDLRLYMCGEELIGLAARLFQGSVTNFRHPMSGFYPVKVV
ncbi:MAG: circularly permuted type 2 ATP-grasp protein [Ghiorsea sp.]